MTATGQPNSISDHLRTLCLILAEQQKPQAIPAEQWPALIEVALEYTVGALLLWQIRAAGMAVNEPMWQPLSKAGYAGAARYALFEHAIGEIEAALSARGIPTLWIKGSALASSVYPNPSCRPMNDLDVLIPANRRGEAREALLARGYRPVENLDHSFGGDREITSHHDKYVGGAGQILVEVHFRLVDPLFSLYDLEWFWRETRPCQAETVTFTTLQPEAHFLYLAAHLVIQHYEQLESDIIHYFDIHRLVVAERIDWEVLVERAAALRWTYAAERMCIVAADLFRTPIPAWVVEGLRSRRTREEERMLKAKLFRTSPTAYTRMVLGALSPLDRIKLAWRIVFPARAFVQRRYGLPPGQRVWPYYVRRWVGLVRRMVGGRF